MNKLDAAVNAFLNLPTRRSMCSIAYTGADAVPQFHPERTDLANIADAYGVSVYDLKKALTAACKAEHEASCGSWTACQGVHS